MSREPSAALERFFEEAFQAQLQRSPQRLTRLGSRLRKDELDDLSAAAEDADMALLQAQLNQLARFEQATMGPEDRLSCAVFRHQAQAQLDRHAFRYHSYPINQKFGIHIEFPAFMINMHAVEHEEDAWSYIARLKAFPRLCDQVIEGLDRRAALGIVPPSFLFPQMLGDCRRFLGDAEPIERNILFQDLQRKAAGLGELSSGSRGGLLDAAKDALRGCVLPAYRRLVARLESLQPLAPLQGGAHSLPNGDAFYRLCLQQETTTELTPEDVHRLGAAEVVRLQQQMRSLQARLGVEGDLQDLFDFAQNEPRFYYSQTEQGQADYLRDLDAVMADMAARLPQLFHVLAQDPLVVKRVEPHRERTAGLAFCEAPAEDGSRPGVFYINLYDMSQLPRFTQRALAYHEALPGHHMQFSIANRLHGLPAFRRHAWYNAYIEGWGLYSEVIAAELGLYADPWDEFGWLVQALKRACRMVADTGLHARGWTREEAITYLMQNLPGNRAQATNEVDRYLVMPGQATTYGVGLIELLAFRRRARKALGDRFDLRAFHDELLRHGPLPLDMLAEQVERWVLRQA